MKFEKEINFYDTPAIARKFDTQDTSISAINGKISKIISDTQLAQYDNGQNTMASALNTAISTATSNSQTLTSLRSSFNTKSEEFDDFKADYNEQLSTTKQNISTVGSVAASKGKIFSAQPSIPYQVNDIWLKNGQNGSEIYRCITAKTDEKNDVFSNDDWVKATSYATSAELDSLSSTVSTIQQTANSVSLKVQASNNTHKLSDIVNGENYDLGDFVISESGVKRVTVEPNRDGNGNAIYRSTDLSDVTNEIPTSAEISTAIDNGISKATIKADHIDFDSFELNMNSTKAKIKSSGFLIDNEGATFDRLTVVTNSWGTHGQGQYGTPATVEMTGGYSSLITLACDGRGLPDEFEDFAVPESEYFVKMGGCGFRAYSDYSTLIIGALDQGNNVTSDRMFDEYDLNGWSVRTQGKWGSFDRNFVHTPMMQIVNKEGREYGHAAFYDNGISFMGGNDSDSFLNVWTIRCGALNCKGLNCSGAKRRVIEDTQYGDISMYAYETPSPMFGDIGEGVIGEDGKAYIYFDPKFLETIKTDTMYQVFLQKYGEGDLYVEEREKSFFVVKGTPNMKFGWETKHRQAKIDYKRLDNPYDEKYLHKSENYGIISDRYVEKLRKERVTV